jgi:hypothetical protein
MTCENVDMQGCRSPLRMGTGPAGCPGTLDARGTVAVTSAAGYAAVHPGTAGLARVHGYEMASACAAGILTVAGLTAMALINALLGKNPGHLQEG